MCDVFVYVVWEGFVCVCVCVCARARASARAHVCVCLCEFASVHVHVPTRAAFCDVHRTGAWQPRGQCLPRCSDPRPPPRNNQPTHTHTHTLTHTRTYTHTLQLAHKCILNSFYGYVMRKGARWGAHARMRGRVGSTRPPLSRKPQPHNLLIALLYRNQAEHCVDLKQCVDLKLCVTCASPHTNPAGGTAWRWRAW